MNEAFRSQDPGGKVSCLKVLAVQALVADYKQRFRQEAVLRVKSQARTSL